MASSSSFEDDPVTSRLSEEQREANRKERAARRKKRDKRREEASEASKKSAIAKGAGPRLTQEEKDARDAKLGCCYRFAEFLVKFIHLVDAIIGLIFIIYGGLIYEGFDEPAMEAVTACLVFGTTMLLTSLMGAFGFVFQACSRCSLVLSAFISILIALLYIITVIALLSDSESFFNYLEEHKDVMYLNEAEIETLKQLLPLFYVILLTLAAVELTR